MDAETTAIVAQLIAEYDAAAAAENLAEMSRIVDVCATSPNQPFRKEVLRQLRMA